MNVYVRRNQNGRIDMVTHAPYEDENGATNEALPDDHADVLAFLHPASEIPTLDESKVTLCAKVDAGAEATRLKYITDGAGQAMTYQQKAAEAAACLADPAPDPASYPLLAAEIGITAASLTDVAQIVYGAHQQWRVIGAQIEALRLGAKSAINAAATAEGAEAAAVVVWPG